MGDLLSIIAAGLLIILVMVFKISVQRRLEKKRRMKIEKTRNLKDYPDVLTVKELKEFLGICEPKIYDMLQNEEIKSLKVGRKYLIPKMYINIYLMRESLRVV